MTSIAHSEILSIRGFTGTTNEKLIKERCKAYGANYKRLLQVLEHPRFEELGAVLVPIEARGGLAQLDHLDPNDAVLLDYYAAIFESIERAFNVGIPKRNEIDVGPEIFAAMSIMRESQLTPHTSFENLPPMNKIDGLTDDQTMFNNLMNRYDKKQSFDRFE